MKPIDTPISHVSDTAIWVAYYRAKETERADALFRDPLAKLLIGERGQDIVNRMGKIGQYTEWSVVSRTVIIDKLIKERIAEGVDTVINLGTGLDTRPYRMRLPTDLRWIEVDYPSIIELKNKVLKSEKPMCQLERLALDLADVEKRRAFLAEVGSQSEKVLVLTEGVIPYLDPEQVASLAQDLRAQKNFRYWITEFFDPLVYKYLKGSLRNQKMRKAPFLFYPPDWLEFFEKNGWIPEVIKYSSHVAIQHKRKIPMPWWANIFKLIASKSFKEKSQKMSGYMVFTPKP